MKLFLGAIFILAFVFCSCQAPQERAALEQYEAHMQAAWLRDHIIIGQTTGPEILAWFGKPMNKTAYGGSGLAAAIMPEEMWTYAVRFSEEKGGALNLHEESRTHVIVFSFKGGKVSSFNTSTTQ